MTQLFLVALIALFLSVPTFAKEFLVTGCTTDKQAVSSKVDVTEDPSHDIERHVADAFTKAASELPAADFVSAPGFVAFASKLDEVDYAAINNITAPQVVGTCKQ